MKHFANDFALRELRQKRKLFRGEYLLLIFTALLLALVLCMGDTVSNTVIQRRFDAYGSWRYAAKGGTNLSGLEDKITREGSLTLYGEGENRSLVGSTDQAAVDIGRLATLDGRLPENENEIAVELSTLTRMGYSYDLGQEIELAVYPYQWDDEVQNYILPEEPVTVTYTLCGTLADRSSSWSVDLPAIYLTEAGAARLDPAIDSQVVRLLEMEELPEQESAKLGLSRNDRAYPMDVLANVDKMMTYIVLLVCLVCAGLLLVTVNAAVQRRRETWVTLRKLGAPSRSLFSVVLLEQAYLTAAALPIGFCAGIALSWAVTALSTNVFHYILEFTFSWFSLLLAAGLSALCAFLGSLIAGNAAARVKMLPIEKRKAGKERRKKHSKPKSGLKKLGAREMLRARRRLHPLSSFLSGAVTVGAMIVVAALLLPLSEQMWQYELRATNTKSADFLLDNANFTQGSGFADTTLQEIRAVYGVERVSPYTLTNYRNSPEYSLYYSTQVSRALNLGGSPVEEPEHFGLDLSEKQDEYYEINEFQVRQDIVTFWSATLSSFLGSSQINSGEDFDREKYAKTVDDFPIDPKKYPVDIFAGETAEDLERFVRLAEGGEAVDMDELLAGKACVLFLPMIYEQPQYAPYSEFGQLAGTQEEIAAGVKSKFYRSLKREENIQYRIQGLHTIDAEAIRPGDMLTVSLGEEKRQIKVAAVLRDLPSAESYPPAYLLGSYSVITGADFYSLFDKKVVSGANLVTVKCSPNADYSSTQVQMSRILARINSSMIGIYTSNNLQEKTDLQASILTGAALSALFIILYLMVTLVLLGLLASARLEENKKRIGSYKMLGADDGKIRRSFWLEGLFSWLTGCLLALTGLYAVWISLDIYHFGFIYPLRYYLFPGSSNITFFKFQWGAFGLFAAALLFIVEFFQLWPLRKFFRQSPVEQLTRSE